MRTRSVLRFLISAPLLAVLGYGATSSLLWWAAAKEMSGERLKATGELRGRAGDWTDRLLRAAAAAEGRSYLDRSCADDLRASLIRSPWVKDAEVKRAHKGRLVARVSLREAVCRVEGCRTFALDGEAVVVPVSSDVSERLPVVKGCPVTNVLPGKKWPDEGAVAAAEVACVLKRVGDVREVRVIREGGKLSCVGILASGTRVVWGAPGDVPAKERKLSRALDAAERSGRRPSYIDLRFRQPVYGLAEDG